MNLGLIFTSLFFSFGGWIMVFLGLFGIKFRWIYLPTSRGTLKKQGNEAIGWGIILIITFGFWALTFSYIFLDSVTNLLKYPVLTGLLAMSFYIAKWYAHRYGWHRKHKKKTKV